MASKKAKSTQIEIILFSLLGVIFILVIALVVSASQGQTSWFNFAMQPQNTPASQALTNLNSTTDQLASLNADGTMGPQTAEGNWSNSLPDFLKGTLVFAVTDPVEGGRPVDNGNHGQRPSISLPPQALSNGEGSNSGKQNGPQSVIALNMTISKVEVHIAYLGSPQDHEQITPAKISVTPGHSVDHWETLNIPNPQSIDLVQLANTNATSSLGLTNLAAGRYTEVRLYVSDATATLSDGSTVSLQIPGKSNIVRVVQSFSIVSGKATSLIMDFDAQHSVIKAGDIYLLKPVVARLIQQ